ncbi:MAG TPA: AAA family ATPase [Anaeromyxobacteraceae bacterium]|nr:AAA family ATPase [Anaeromyxobacteraceae bacterium]
MSEAKQDSEATLRVTEAFVEDVGRGWARLDADDLKALGAAPGDALLLTGGRTTVARAVQAPPSHCGQRLILIDGTVRGNAQAGVDEQVRVRRVPFRTAASLLLAPVEAGLPLPADSEIPALRQLLSGRPFLLGDRLHVSGFGARPRSFTVEGASPRGALIVSSDTEIAFRAPESAGEAARVSYEDIGGLDREVALVRELVELPLRFPELFGALGIEPPRGLLLVGPPGTGKTLIARAASSEVRAHFIHVNGPEVIHKYYGESEARLRAVFEEARQNAPSIIFLDEIDALAPKRAQVIGDVEKRVTAQLLALMDGLQERGQVVVMGATNLPEMVDPALRRPGRFDREVNIGVPDRSGRRQILHIHSRRMPLAPSVDLDRLADIAHGYVGADLSALCKEAGMVALRRLLPGLTFEVERRPSLDGLKIEVTQQDFLEAFKAIEPTATREFLAERPRLGLKDVGGLAEAKRVLRSIVGLARGGGLFPNARLDPPKGILLTGPSGTGKTLLARALAGELGLTLIGVDLTSLLSKWVGESEKGLREVFRRAKQASPCVLFFDDIEALAPARSAQEGGSLAPRLVAQLFRELDQLHGSLGVLVLGATNRVDLLEPALLRPGRFDYALELPLPDARDRREILALHAAGLPLADDVDLDEVAERTEGFSGADLELVCKRAAILALEAGGEWRPGMRIARAQVQEALAQVRGPAVPAAARFPGSAGRRSAG